MLNGKEFGSDIQAPQQICSDDYHQRCHHADAVSLGLFVIVLGSFQLLVRVRWSEHSCKRETALSKTNR